MPNDFGSPAVDISLREYVEVLHRRRAIVVQTVVAVLAVGFVLNLVTKPRYRSDTRILLEGKSNAPSSVDAENPLANLFLQDSGHAIATQIGVIQGELVIADACADASKNFGIKIAPGSIQTTVTPVTGTDLVDIAVESENPVTASKLAEQIPKTYNAHTLKSQTNDINKAKEMAQSQLNDAKRDLRGLGKRLARLRQQSGVFNVEDDIKSKGSNILDAQSALLSAQATEAMAQTKLKTLIEQRSKLKPYTESSTEAPNPDIPQLHSEIDSLHTQREGMMVLLNHSSPKVEAIDKQIDDLQARLAKAPATIITVIRKPNDDLAEYDRRINDTRIELSSAETELQAAQTRSTDSTDKLIGAGDNEDTQAQVEEELDRIKAKVLMLTKSKEDLDLREVAMHGSVTLVTPAHNASKVSPKQTQNLVFAGILGLVLGVCFALLQEYLDDRVTSPDHVKGLISAPTLGFVPLVEHAPELLAANKSAGALMESYRALRSNVGFATVDSAKNAILVTSTLPGEGKSTTAVNLAAAMALDGKKVILVDLDLRRPSVHTKLGLDASCGVTNVLMGHSSLSVALQKTEFAGLQVLTCGPLPPNPAELLNSQAMRRLLDELKEHAEVVILDSPPLLATADSQVLSALVEGVVFVVQFGAVRKPEIRHAYQLLQQANGKLLGVVFNKIDSSSSSEYSYGVYHYYSHYADTNGKGGDTSQISRIAFKNMIAQIDTSQRGDDLPSEKKEDGSTRGDRNKPGSEKPS